MKNTIFGFIFFFCTVFCISGFSQEWEKTYNLFLTDFQNQNFQKGKGTFLQHEFSPFSFSFEYGKDWYFHFYWSQYHI